VPTLGRLWFSAFFLRIDALCFVTRLFPCLARRHLWSLEAFETLVFPRAHRVSVCRMTRHTQTFFTPRMPVMWTHRSAVPLYTACSRTSAHAARRIVLYVLQMVTPRGPGNEPHFGRTYLLSLLYPNFFFDVAHDAGLECRACVFLWVFFFFFLQFVLSLSCLAGSFTDPS